MKTFDLSRILFIVSCLLTSCGSAEGNSSSQLLPYVEEGPGFMSPKPLTKPIQHLTMLVVASDRGQSGSCQCDDGNIGHRADNAEINDAGFLKFQSGCIRPMSAPADPNTLGLCSIMNTSSKTIDPNRWVLIKSSVSSIDPLSLEENYFICDNVSVPCPSEAGLYTLRLDFDGLTKYIQWISNTRSYFPKDIKDLLDILNSIDFPIYD
jgi:hypothetical protein